MIIDGLGSIGKSNWIVVRRFGNYGAMGFEWGAYECF